MIVNKTGVIGVILSSHRTSNGVVRQECGPLGGPGCAGCSGAGNRDAERDVQTGVDDDERQALEDEGLNPDNPAVIVAIDLVRWELSLGT